MTISFKSVKMFNFLSFEEAYINLDAPGFTLVNGINSNPDDAAISNGAGKSSIWEAISWCLTGETIRGTKEVKRFGSTEKCSVTVEFEFNKDSYLITRTKDPSNLFVTVNGENRSGKGIRDTEKLLAEYLPELSSSLLGSVIILGQGLPKRFTNNTPSGRKEVLEKLSNSDVMIFDLKNRISNRKEYLSTLLRKYQDEELVISSNIKLLEKSLENKNFELEKYSSSDMLTDKLDEVSENLRDLQNESACILEEKEELSSEVDNISTKEVSLIKDKTKMIDSISESETTESKPLLEELSSLDSDIKSLTKEIFRLDGITDVCPTCGQKIPNIVKIDTSEMKNELSELKYRNSTLLTESISIKTKYVEEKKRVAEQFDLKAKKLAESKSSLKDRLTSVNSRLLNINSDIARLSSEKSSIETRISMFEESKAKLKGEIKSISVEIKSCTDRHKVCLSLVDDYENRLRIINKMGNIISREFRGYLLEGIIDFINTKSKEYSKIVFNTDKVEFKLDGNNISISYLNKEYENLSGGEKQKVDLIVQLSIRDMLCSSLNFSSNILVLDEIFDSLDSVGCTKVLNLITNKLNDVTSVYIITHRPDLEIPYDNMLNVVKDKMGVSSIV